MHSLKQTYPPANGWIVVARIKLLTVEGYAESSPFAVAVEDEDGAIEVVREAFPVREGVEFAAIEPLSARDLAVLGLQRGQFRAKWKSVAVGGQRGNAPNPGMQYRALTARTARADIRALTVIVQTYPAAPAVGFFLGKRRAVTQRAPPMRFDCCRT
jgi:hypothetical protein